MMYAYLNDRFMTEEDEPKLSVIPLSVAIVLVTCRFFIISVRHGSTPANNMLLLSEKIATQDNLAESLILFAWVEV